MRTKSSRVEIHLGLVRDRQQMQHGIGRAAERHGDGDGILECFLGEDLARGDALPQHLHYRHATLTRKAVAAAIDGWRRGGTGQRHAKRLSGTRHGVGGIHAATGTLSRADRLFDLGDLRRD